MLQISFFISNRTHQFYNTGTELSYLDLRKLTNSRDWRASAMATLVMLAGILFFLQRACNSLLARLWKSISAAKMKQEIDLRLFGGGGKGISERQLDWQWWEKGGIYILVWVHRKKPCQCDRWSGNSNYFELWAANRNPKPLNIGPLM